MNTNPCQIPLPPSPASTVNHIEAIQSPHTISIATSSLQTFNMSIHAKSSETGSSIKLLESSNYHQWNDLMQSYFLKHNLDGIFDGTEPQPTNSTSDSQNWLLRQKKAAGFIARKLDARN